MIDVTKADFLNQLDAEVTRIDGILVNPGAAIMSSLPSKRVCLTALRQMVDGLSVGTLSLNIEDLAYLGFI